LQNISEKYFSIIKIVFSLIILIAIYLQISYFGKNENLMHSAFFYYFLGLLLAAISIHIYDGNNQKKLVLSWRHLEVLIPISVIIYGFVIRLKASSFKPPWGDETYQFFSTMDGNALRFASVQHQTPIDFMMHFASFKFFGNSLLAMRLSSILFSSLALGNLYFLFRKFFKDYPGPLIMLLFFFFNHNFNYSSLEARPPALAFFAITIFLYDLEKYFNDQSLSNKLSIFSSALIYIFCTGIQPFSMIGAMAFISIVIGAIQKDSINKFRQLFFPLAIALFLYLPLFYYLYKMAPSRLPSSSSGLGNKYMQNLFAGFTEAYMQITPLGWVCLICTPLLFLYNFIRKKPTNPLLLFLYVSWIFFQLIYVSVFLTFVQWPLMFWYMLSSTAIVWSIFALTINECIPSKSLRNLALISIFYFYYPKSTLNDIVQNNFHQRNDISGLLNKIEQQSDRSKTILSLCMSYNGCTELFSNYDYIKNSNYRTSLINFYSPFPNANSNESSYFQFEKLRKNKILYFVITDCYWDCTETLKDNFSSPDFFFKSTNVIAFRYKAEDSKKLFKIIDLLEKYAKPTDYPNSASKNFLYEAQIMLHVIIGDKKLAEIKYDRYRNIFKDRIPEIQQKNFRDGMDYLYNH
jgi:hypothetical protein